jgi:hypothetical protein
MDYKEILQQEWDKSQALYDSVKGLTTTNIKGKIFLYSKRKYIGPASIEQEQAIKQKTKLKLLKWTIKNLNQVLASAKLLSELSKTHKTNQ